MACLISKKLKENPDNYAHSARNCRISDGHYRPFHFMLQKNQYRYDSDQLYAYTLTESEEEEDDDIETGINSKQNRAHDVEFFDDCKDDY